MMYQWILFYGIIINMISLALMYADKRRAKRHQWRIPEKVLFLSALLGGSVGSIVGMYLFRHKTKHWYFTAGMPVILVLQLVLLVWLGSL